MFQRVTDQGKFDYVGIMDAVEKNVRDNQKAKFKSLLGGSDVDVVVAYPNMDVTWSSPNSECLY